jgi:hypothetical protein
MAGNLKYTFLDYDGESSTVIIPIDLDAAGWAAGQDELDNVRAAVNGVTLCVHAKEERTQLVSILSGSPPNDPTIPGADYSLLNPANKGRMLISSGAGATLVTQLEGVYKSDRGKGITVEEIVLVGRNS